MWQIQSRRSRLKLCEEKSIQHVPMRFLLFMSGTRTIIMGWWIIFPSHSQNIFPLNSSVYNCQDFQHADLKFTHASPICTHVLFVSAQDVGLSSAFSIKRWFEENEGDEIIMMVHIKNRLSSTATLLLPAQCPYWQIKALEPQSSSFHKDIETFSHCIRHTCCVPFCLKADLHLDFFLLLALRANFILKYYPLFQYFSKYCNIFNSVNIWL